jgi:hypothetical protein
MPRRALLADRRRDTGRDWRRRLRGRSVPGSTCEVVVTLRDETVLRFDPVKVHRNYVEVRTTNTKRCRPYCRPAAACHPTRAAAGRATSDRADGGTMPPAKSEA